MSFQARAEKPEISDSRDNGASKEIKKSSNGRIGQHQLTE